MRLIDADAFRREIDNHWPFTNEEQSKHGIADMAKGTLLYVLNCMPTIEPERKKGRWQEDPSGYGFWICSTCGFVSEASGADLLYKFCPYCGTDMRGDSDDIPIEYFESGGK